MVRSTAVTEPRVFTSKGQATRERIVTAAARLMVERGVAATSWEDIQKAAGVNASQLYHYFGDKQTLVRAVIAYQTQTIITNQQPLLDSLDTFEALRAWRDLIVEHQRRADCKGGCPLVSLTGELAEARSDCRTDLADGFDQWEAPIRDGLRAMHLRGDLRRSSDPDRLATSLLAALQGGLVLAQVHRDTAPLEAALDTMLEHVSLLTVRRRSRGTSPGGAVRATP
ncbi:MAG TPA: TetR/AcrR family transcriptional regulator [Acidimicrobiales bacterium]|nr:TetR/AcrR family transcriptional regulator [Acidimicrobiales bacterium]